MHGVARILHKVTEVAPSVPTDLLIDGYPSFRHAACGVVHAGRSNRLNGTMSFRIPLDARRQIAKCTDHAQSLHRDSAVDSLSSPHPSLRCRLVLATTSPACPHSLSGLRRAIWSLRSRSCPCCMRRINTRNNPSNRLAWRSPAHRRHLAVALSGMRCRIHICTVHRSSEPSGH